MPRLFIDRGRVIHYTCSNFTYHLQLDPVALKMKTSFDCIPCFIRQTLNTVKLASDDPGLHEKALREILTILSRLDFQAAPVVMGRTVHRVIQVITGVRDPYLSVKQQFNQMMLDLYPTLKARLNDSEDPFEVAVRLALAGNMIDFGAGQKLRPVDVTETIEASLTAKIAADIHLLRKAVDMSDTIVYLGDNCGEIILDRLFIEQLIPDKVTYVVRAAPIINDVTMNDATFSGIADLVHVIDNGSDAPGTLLDECSPRFKEVFENADLIIAKGQGNYETLHAVHKHIFFMLKVKCPVVARHIGHKIGDYVINEHIPTG